MDGCLYRTPRTRKSRSIKWTHGAVINWNIFHVTRPFVRGIHLTPVDSPHKGQRRAALMFSFIYGWVNGWAYNRDAGALRHHRAHFDVKIQIHVALVAITGTPFRVTYLSVKLLSHVWRSGTRRFHLRVFDLQMSCSDLNVWQDKRIALPAIASGWHWL